MPEPLVSIIIPVYNAEKYITKTITSALNQTWRNIEIIIIDDGSTDNSLAIAKQFKNEHIVILSKQNQGASKARNKGLQEAKGAFIQFLDADDLLSPNKIAEQVKLLLQNPEKIAVCSTVHFFDNQNPYEALPSAYEDSFLFDTDNPAEFLINLYGGDTNRGSMVQTSAWLTPTDIIKKAGKWSEFYLPDEDGDYFCRAVLASKGIIYADSCFNYYRKYTNSKNLSAVKTKESLEGKLKSFLLKKEHLLNATNNPVAKKALAHSAMDLAIIAFNVDKTLTNQILKVIEDLGGTSSIPVLGGKEIELIKKIFGWKTALRLQYYCRRLFSA
ncbi:MAG: glycosyltransferase family 2 protein [Mucilaginibacter sp.]|uniref:glycosyltransferase family 2 protein n=1 Tax=Mucilaginibacter sp. TaxID=1882438 RepID=UPI0034E600C4